MLPRPRRRIEPDVVRARLRALAQGTIGAATLDPPAEPVDDELSRDPVVVVRPSLRPAALALGAAGLTVWLVLRTVAGPSPAPVELVVGTPVPTSSAQASATPAPSEAPTVVVVHLIGEVRRPGLVQLAAGARVADALRAAGGLVPGGSSGALNLARPVVDGEQIVVSRDAVAAPAPAPSGAGVGAAVVDLNTATLADLDTLPGVGPVMSARIIDWRTSHGRFVSVDQLREVSGIGASTLERLRPHVRV